MDTPYMSANLFAKTKTALYLIMDAEACAARGIKLHDFFQGAVDGGVGIIQYRHKNVGVDLYEKNLQEFFGECKKRKITLILNDHATLAEKYGLPLHIGQTDFLPPNLAVPYGRSVHSMDELSVALSGNPKPSYIALGSMFVSATKPELPPVRVLAPIVLEKIDIPLVLIGGISLENASRLPHSNRVFYAIIGDAFRFGATRNGIERYVQSWLNRTVTS